MKAGEPSSLREPHWEAVEQGLTGKERYVRRALARIRHGATVAGAETVPPPDFRSSTHRPTRGARAATACDRQEASEGLVKRGPHSKRASGSSSREVSTSGEPRAARRPWPAGRTPIRNVSQSLADCEREPTRFPMGPRSLEPTRFPVGCDCRRRTGGGYEPEGLFSLAFAAVRRRWRIGRGIGIQAKRASHPRWAASRELTHTRRETE